MTNPPPNQSPEPRVLSLSAGEREGAFSITRWSFNGLPFSGLMLALSSFELTLSWACSTNRSTEGNRKEAEST
jgi:hypothetical protein